MVGLNHGCWSYDATYDGRDFVAVIAERLASGPTSCRAPSSGWPQLAVTMDAVPADYFKYYYFEDEVLAELQAKPTTRAEDILSWAPAYWQHYAEQLTPTTRSSIRPARAAASTSWSSRSTSWTPSSTARTRCTRSTSRTPAVRCPGCPRTSSSRCTAARRDGWIEPQPAPPLQRHLRGLVEALGEYQYLAAEAAWAGDRRDAVRALAANPLVRTLPRAERLYGALAAAHRAHLPERLAA